MCLIKEETRSIQATPFKNRSTDVIAAWICMEHYVVLNYFVLHFTLWISVSVLVPVSVPIPSYSAVFQTEIHNRSKCSLNGILQGTNNRWDLINRYITNGNCFCSLRGILIEAGKHTYGELSFSYFATNCSKIYSFHIILLQLLSPIDRVFSNSLSLHILFNLIIFQNQKFHFIANKQQKKISAENYGTWFIRGENLKYYSKIIKNKY